MPINDPSQCVSVPIFIYSPIQYSYKSPSPPVKSLPLNSILLCIPPSIPSPSLPHPLFHPPIHHLTTSPSTLTHTRPLALTACKNAP